jgi:plastocyanin
VKGRETMRFGLAWAATLVAAVIVVACGGGGKDTRDEDIVVGGMNETITIEDYTYIPGNLQVPVGASVTWVNKDSAVHDAKDDDGAWETENLREDDEGTIVFDEPGVYPYHCSLHPSMKAQITVVRE